MATDVVRSGRVRQVEGLFDVPPAERPERRWELPDQLTGIEDEDDWNVGLIVGPSGSGKTIIANEVFDGRVVKGFEWPKDKAVVDAIEGPVRDVVRTFTDVGFGSPPAWLRPYRTLSTGEQFRATIARAITESPEFVCVDEFTSVVDRQVAQIASHAIQRATRKRGHRFVAVTCHADVLDWLQPDWAYRPDSGQMESRSLQRHPPLTYEIRRVGRDAWPVFAPHHYLSGELHVAARCAAGFINGEACAFFAWYPFPHPRAKDIMIGHRVVVLPDYQGLGLGGRLSDYVGQLLHTEGRRLRITTAHPARVAHMRHSASWDEIESPNLPSKSRKPKRFHKQHASLRKLATTTFEYVPVG